MCDVLEEEIEKHLKIVDAEIDIENIDFERFARLIAILLEELNAPAGGHGGAGGGLGVRTDNEVPEEEYVYEEDMREEDESAEYM